MVQKGARAPGVNALLALKASCSTGRNRDREGPEWSHINKLEA